MHWCKRATLTTQEEGEEKKNMRAGCVAVQSRVCLLSAAELSVRYTQARTVAAAVARLRLSALVREETRASATLHLVPFRPTCDWACRSRRPVTLSEASGLGCLPLARDEPGSSFRLLVGGPPPLRPPMGLYRSLTGDARGARALRHLPPHREAPLVDLAW